MKPERFVKLREKVKGYKSLPHEGDIELSNIAGWCAYLELDYYVLYNEDLSLKRIYSMRDRSHNYNELINDVKEVLRQYGNIVDVSFAHPDGCYQIWVTDGTVDGTHMFTFNTIDEIVVEIVD
jgi:hypothetical protein